MPAANRIRPHDVFSNEEWAVLSKRQNWRGPLLVLHAWGLIALAMGVFAIWPNPLTFLIAVMITGSRQLGIAILMHEAAHGGLSKNRKINDFLGHWLCAAPVGASLTSYRQYHLAHHKYVQNDEDPDLILTETYPVSRASLRRKFIRDLTGQTFLRQRLAGLASLSRKTENSSEKPNTEQLPKSAAQIQAEVLSGREALRDHLVANALLFTFCVLLGVWWVYPAIWLVALATWFPFITRIRNIAEHACVPTSDDPLAHARTTHARWWERLLIAPYWVHYHSEHHAFMHLPCYRLPHVHRALAEKGLSKRIPQCNSYHDVLETIVR